MNKQELRSYVYITVMNSLYVMPREKFVAYMRQKAAGENPNPGTFGFYVGMTIDATEMGTEEARQLLLNTGHRV